MRTCIGLLFVACLICSGYCQLTGMMENPALMMSMMRSMGAGGGGAGGMPMMDLSAAPVIDPQTFAKMAKLAALMGTPKKDQKKTTMASKGNAVNALKLAQQQLSAKQASQSSGIDPMMMYFMMQQNMDPLTMMLMSQASRPSPASSSGGLDPMTMYMLMQGGGSIFG